MWTAYLHRWVPGFGDTFQQKIIHQFTDSEDWGSQQQPQKPSNLTQQTQELKSWILLNNFFAQSGIVYVHSQKVISGKGKAYHWNSKDYSSSNFVVYWSRKHFQWECEIYTRISFCFDTNVTHLKFDSSSFIFALNSSKTESILSTFVKNRCVSHENHSNTDIFFSLEDL